MTSEQKDRAVRHFAKHLFAAGKTYTERKKARKELNSFVEKMKSSIIRMNLSYTDIERLKKRIDSAMLAERKFGSLFRGEDKEDHELKQEIMALEEQLSREREEKLRIRADYEDRMKYLSQSLESVKSKMNHLLIHKAKSQHRINEIDKKIKGRIVVRE